MNITTNSANEIALIPGRDYTAIVLGTFGTGTLAVALKDPVSGSSIAMTDHSTLTAADTWVFTAPTNILLLTMTGAGGTSIQVHINLCEQP